MNRIVVVALCSAIGTLGCQRYQRKPVNLSSHREAFVARMPDSPDVASLASQLAEREKRPAAGFDTTDGISIREAEAIALVFNADLRVARARLGIAKAGSEEAGRWEDPVLGVDISRILEGSSQPWSVAGVIGFTIPISGRLAIERKKAGAEYAAELIRAAQLEWETRIALRRAWAEWSALDARYSSMTAFMSNVGQVVGVVDAMERAGELARIEARLFRIEQASRRAELTALDSSRRESELRIRRLMGLPPSNTAALVPGGLGDRRATAGVESLSARAEAGSLIIEVAKSRYEVAERALELEIRKQYPDLQIGPGVGTDEGRAEWLLNFSLPIPVLNANRRAIAEATAAREAARAELEAALEHLLSDLGIAEREFQAAAANRRVMEEEIIPMVDEQYADARRVAQLGEISTLVLLESLTRQHEARMRLIDSHQADVRALIRMEELVGPERQEVTP